MAGSTGERPFADIVTDFEFWKLHVVNIPAIFISGFLFVLTGLAYDTFGTPRPDEYFPYSERPELPIIRQRMEARTQLDEYFEKDGSSVVKAPEIFEIKEN